MSIFGKLFKDRETSIAQIRIAFPDDFENSWAASVVAKPEVRKGMENWIWDLYYAKTLYGLGKCPFSEGLQEELETWATKWAAVLLGELPLPPLEMLAIDENLVLGELSAAAEDYVIDVVSGNRRVKDWELIQTHLPKGGHKNRMAFSVLALTHYYFANDNAQFTRALPIHILAMHSYYREKANYDKLISVLGAPVFAVDKEMRFREDILRSTDE